jgi:hypothetical protein
MRKERKVYGKGRAVDPGLLGQKFPKRKLG